MPISYTFPSHYPKNCPPRPREEMCGTYYRVVKNQDKSDPIHFKSHYEMNQQPKLEHTNPCSRRALSMFKIYDDAINLSRQIPTIGKYIALLNLIGGHGVVCNDDCTSNSHHDWWVPIKVNAADFCLKIEGPVS